MFDESEERLQAEQAPALRPALLIRARQGAARPPSTAAAMACSSKPLPDEV